jgi:cytochrome o ubiquinol oxidase operon protein cyoD
MFNYIIGYALSLLLTGAAFVMAQTYLASGYPSLVLLLPLLALLAVLQLAVQLVFFLHFGKKTNPWNRVLFVFTLFTVVLIVGGTLWIMNNLEHNQMEPFKNGEITPQMEM